MTTRNVGGVEAACVESRSSGNGVQTKLESFVTMSASISGSYIIQEFSTVNLRSNRGVRQIKDPIQFTCTVCKRRRNLGRETGALYRIMTNKEEIWCDRCFDIILDVMRFGPNIVGKGSTWRINSRILRVSVVTERLMCFRCLKTQDAHLYVRFENLEMLKRRQKSKSVFRCCSKCLFAYVEIVRHARFMTKRLRYVE